MPQHKTILVMADGYTANNTRPYLLPLHNLIDKQRRFRVSLKELLLLEGMIVGLDGQKKIIVRLACCRLYVQSAKW